MNGELFLVLIDLIENYGLQALGIIVIILISQPIVLGLLGLVRFILGVGLKISDCINVILQAFFHYTPKVFGKSFDKISKKLEAGKRKIDSLKEAVENWFNNADTKYTSVHQHLISGIKFFGIFVVAIYGIVFIINVLIQKTLTVEQIISYISSI